ncbi:hypothetical protein Pmar_PMAR013659, partial [Perkinsus marinus ATCC 50983]
MSRLFRSKTSSIIVDRPIAFTGMKVDASTQTDTAVRTDVHVMTEEAACDRHTQTVDQSTKDQ